MKTRRSIKCVVEPCRFEGRDAVKKRLERFEPPWPFYMKREIAIHRAFATLDDLPVRTPRMLDAGDGFIVFERIDGAPLAAQRHVVPEDRDVWEAMIDVVRAIRSITVAIDVEPTEDDRRAMRERLLEDPTSDWIASGLLSCATRGLVEKDVASRLAGDVKKGSFFQHGDLLLRNVMRDAAGLAIVDWECAGTHADGWDAALLSVFAPAWARALLARGSDPRSFHACYVFALLREIVFRHGKKDDVTAQLEAALADALEG